MLPHYCLEGSDIWLARVPLICFSIIEYYYPDRVLQQFGGYQSQPQAPVDTTTLHAIDLRGRHDWNWATEHASWIAEWDSRRECIIQLAHDPTGTSPDYLPWYQGITRRYIGRTGTMFGHMMSYLFTPTNIDFSFFPYCNIGFYDLL